jgi:hypothetical protein
VAYRLEHLLGKSIENVREIEDELNAGRWVLVDGRCARKLLVNAGFVEQQEQERVTSARVSRKSPRVRLGKLSDGATIGRNEASDKT